MTNRGHRWSVAAAKAELSRVVASAQLRPQIIERRGKPVAIVVAIAQFDDRDARGRWVDFVDASAEIRAEGGAELRVPRRGQRPSPFGHG